MRALFLSVILQVKNTVITEADPIHHNSQGIEPAVYLYTPLPEGTNASKAKHIDLTDADIKNIVNPPVENRILTAGDIRILAALIKAPNEGRILVDRLAELISPHKISGFSEEIASLPARINFYNMVIFEGTTLRIRSITGYPEDPVGYYVFSSERDLNLKQRIKVLTRSIRNLDTDLKKSKKKDAYGISTQKGRNNSLSLSIVKNGERTRPVFLKEVIFKDDREGVNFPTYHIKTPSQAKIVEMLFQNNPISTRVLRLRLADDKEKISQRELQLIIDLLNGTLVGNNSGENLRKLGLCIVQKKFNRAECIALAKYDPQTFQPVDLPGQYETLVEVEDQLPPRQRRRNPTHDKLRL